MQRCQEREAREEGAQENTALLSKGASEVPVVVTVGSECGSEGRMAEVGKVGVDEPLYVELIIFLCFHGGRKPSALSSDDARGGA